MGVGASECVAKCRLRISQSWRFQDKFKAEPSQDLFVSWQYKPPTNSDSAAKSNQTDSDENADNTQKQLTPVFKEPKVYQRYYHLFEKGELERVCQQVESVEIEESFYDRDNWCVILRKK